MTAASKPYLLVFVLVVLLGAVLRFSDLSAKPMHGDEANQALKTAHLLETGEYAYDPFEHHGPTLYYLTLPVLWLSGVHTLAESEAWQYRVVTAFFGVLTIVLIYGLRDALGPAGTLWAALFCAVSHAMLYYARYYIQETLFTAFALAAIVAGWRYLKSPSLAWALIFGLALGLLQATKETSILLYAAAGAALAGTVLIQRFQTGAWPGLRPFWRPKHIAAAVLGALLVCVLFYSSFFSHPQGLIDAFATYTRYFNRAEGAGSAALHKHPFYYYLQILSFIYREPGPWWTEAPVLILAVLGVGLALFTRAATPASQLRRFLALYAVVLTVLFSAVPYKTPWNLLLFWQPLLLLAGLAAGTLSSAPRWPLLRGALCLACTAVAAHAGRQTYQGAFVYPADTRNPYVYAHTSTALARVKERVEQIAAIHPQHEKLLIGVVGAGGDYWPLPWTLRGYPNTGFWSSPPEKLDADIVIASAVFAQGLAERLGPAYHVEMGALRPGTMLAVFVKTPLWDAFMATRQ